MSHDRKHSINSDVDHLGILNVEENNIVTFNNLGLLKDSNLKKNDIGNSESDLLSANQINKRLEIKAQQVIEDNFALGFYLSLIS